MSQGPFSADLLIVPCRILTALALWAVLGAAALPAQSVTVSPALPTTLDPIVLQAFAGCPIFNTPPTVNGNTITLIGAGNTIDPCLPIQPPAAFTLAPLPAGTYTVREVVNGNVSPGVAGFQVKTPAPSLGLVNARFVTTLAFTKPQKRAQTPAQAVQLSDAAGYFWFFDSANVEVTVKILDGVAINQHYWVFISSMTEVPFTVTITDTQPAVNPTCAVRTYTSPGGQNQNFIDLQAFALVPVPPCRPPVGGGG